MDMTLNFKQVSTSKPNLIRLNEKVSFPRSNFLKSNNHYTSYLIIVFPSDFNECL